MLDCPSQQVSSDFYEGIKPATFQDIESIIELLQPLVTAGVVVYRSPEKIMQEINDYTVVIRDSKVAPRRRGEVRCRDGMRRIGTAQTANR